MSNRNFFRPGSHYFICDVCGNKFHAEEKRIRWDNMVVCPDDFEYRHPQDFLRAREDKQSVPNARPQPTVSYIARNYQYRLPMYDDDTVNLTESFSHLIDYVRSVNDTVTTSDLLGINESKGLLEGPSMTDDLASVVTYVRAFTETLTSSDSLVNDFSMPQEINGASINEYSIG